MGAQEELTSGMALHGASLDKNREAASLRYVLVRSGAKGFCCVETHPEFPLDEVGRELQLLESGSVGALTEEQLLLKIRALHDGFQIVTPLFPAGTVFYRAVRVTQRPTEKLRVSYAPPEFTKKNGRLNRAGESMFYGAFSLFTGLMECGCQVGEFFAVSGWLTNHAMAFNHLGYSSETLKARNSGREFAGLCGGKA